MQHQQLDEATQRIKETWNNFSANYTVQIAPSLASLGYGLVTQLSLTSSKSPLNVLESGCGPGIVSQLCARLLPPGSNYYVTDISDKMVDICKQELASLGASQVNIHVSVQNAEKLCFESKFFDRYFANMVIHLVANAKNMMYEAFRVMKPGGITVFSVWGRRANSPMVTLVPKVIKDLGLEAATSSAGTSDAFHLGEDLQILRKMALESGFSKAIVYYQNMVYDVTSGEEFATKIFAGLHKSVHTQFPEDKFQMITKEVATRAQKMIDQGMPIQLEAGVIVAVV